LDLGGVCRAVERLHDDAHEVFTARRLRARDLRNEDRAVLAGGFGRRVGQRQHVEPKVARLHVTDGGKIRGREEAFSVDRGPTGPSVGTVPGGDRRRGRRHRDGAIFWR
jgi:hypothetical protein